MTSVIASDGTASLPSEFSWMISLMWKVLIQTTRWHLLFRGCHQKEMESLKPQSLLSKLPLEGNASTPYARTARKLHDFLQSNNYVVLPTDKNLRISVVTREWFITNIQKLLDNRDSYVPLSVQECCMISPIYMVIILRRNGYTTPIM